jgi:hypothetical protein
VVLRAPEVTGSMRLSCCLCALVVILRPATAQIAGSASGLSYDVDIRKAAEENGAFGVDFDVRYDRERSAPNPQGNHYGVGLRVGGFQAFGDGTEDVNEMFGEIALRGRYYRSEATVLPAWQQTRYLQLAECDPAAAEPADSASPDPRCSDYTPEDWAEYNELFKRLRKQRRFFSYDLHYRYEATQDLSRGQHVFGLGVGGELPRLAEALDVIPAVTRDSSAFRPQDVRGYAGVDYVDPQSDVALVLGAASSFWRARGELAWNTQIFNDLVLRATWVGHYLFDVPDPIEAADRTFNSFLQLWVNYPVSSQTALLIKYVSGRVPPEYESTSLGSVGFSLTLQ